MPVADLLLSIPPPFSKRLKCSIDQLRSRIVRANYYTQFAQTAPELADFRHATVSFLHGMDDGILSEAFQKTVPFTTYDAYAPLLAKLDERPCKASAIADLLAPGLPDYLVESSSTSGGLPKRILRYNQLAKIRASDAESSVITDPLQRHTTVNIFWLATDRMDIVDDNNCPVATLYQSIGTAVGERARLSLDPERDEERMATFLLDHAAPHAVGFTKKWRSFLLIHALFAVGNRSTVNFNMAFISTFMDMMRALDTEFDLVVNCIANGAIPDLDGIAEIRHYLETNLSPDPERATELRDLGRPFSRPGWCGLAWPDLRSVTAISSGSFAQFLPLVQWLIGPNAIILPHGYGSTEVWIGAPYNHFELNQFKLSTSDIIEFLDVGKNDSISSIAQPWEVERGRRYELIVTTRDGLWRYRLADVVEIAGFDPTDGVPVVQFVERRNVAIRFPAYMVSEEELRKAMSALAPNMLTKVVNWTSTIDDRNPPLTIGFFVELADNQVSESDLALTRDRVFEELLRLNKHIHLIVSEGIFRKPTIRLVRCGTFSDFLQLKLDEGSSNFGQVKVPVVLPKVTYVTWFMDQVLREL